MIPKLSTIPIVELASGDRLSLQVYRFVGISPGPKAYLQANLHGAEISGNAVIGELIEFLQTLNPQQLRGEICLVPTCNPMGINQRSHHFSSGRYNPYDGRDWNRIFWDYTKNHHLRDFAKAHLQATPAVVQTNFRNQILRSFQKIANKLDSPRSVPFYECYRYHLQSLCLDANYVIDLHSSTNEALNHLYCCQTREESAQAFLFDYGILLDEYDGDAFDEAFIRPWLVLEQLFAQLGRNLRFDVEAWTLEIGGGMTMDSEAVAAGVRGIKNYLATKGVLDLPDFPMAPAALGNRSPQAEASDAAQKRPIRLVPKTDIQTYYAPRGGMVQKLCEVGTNIQKGDLLYEMLCFPRENQFPQVHEVRADADGMVFDRANNHSANQGDYIVSLL